jgi:uncharacterized membrane protein
MFLGESQKKIWDIVGGHRFIYFIMIAIIIIAISQVFGGQLSPYETGEDGEEKSIGTEALKAITNPKLLGALFILIVAAYAIQQISQKPI